jgi:outer membrane receptor protein involved in Fe transport
VLLDSTIGVRRQVQELRLTSPRGVVEWLAGYFYNHEKATADKTIVSRFAASGNAGPPLADSSIPSEYTENALFGDITWNPTERVSFTGGMRGARNKQTFTQISDGALLGGATELHGDSSESTRTYLATAR